MLRWSWAWGCFWARPSTLIGLGRALAGLYCRYACSAAHKFPDAMARSGLTERRNRMQNCPMDAPPLRCDAAHGDMSVHHEIFHI
ncbi:hypothetical protein BDV10DRAFT_171839 [Aspergillus recurvatus]